MHRFFVEPGLLEAGPTLQLGGALAHQIDRVLHLRSGERIILIAEPELTPRDEEWLVRLESVGPRLVTASVEERRPAQREPALRLTLYQAALKGDQLDDVIHRGTEVGLHAIMPVITERTIVRTVDERKLSRWRRIAREAAELAGRTWIPTIGQPQSLTSLIAGRTATASPLIVLWEEERQTSLLAGLAGWTGPGIDILIGPEGGLGPDEVERLIAVGARSVTLGPRLLRAGTAALVAAGIILHHTDALA